MKEQEPKRRLVDILQLKLKEAERRALVAERALMNACVNAVKDEKDDVYIDIELLVRVVYDKYLRQAEKELAEERKNYD